ncbi:MAG: GNAT family N-acetyltransferase [Betaproteobacteria bacterium]|nr:GNAT family N-acetyltransferase [Betaproteobacteria bacterium]
MTRAPSYPSHLVRAVLLADGTPVTIRPIRGEDADIEQAFVRGLSGESRYYRFMDTLRELTPQMLSHFTQIDYAREMALIAVVLEQDRQRQIGVARYVIGPDGASCEFAIVVADEWQRRGVGRALMQALIGAAREQGLQTMFGDVLAGNHRMLHFMSTLGFRLRSDEDDARVVRVEKRLDRD